MKSIVCIPLLCVTVFSELVAQNIVTVTDCNLQGWTKQQQANTSLAFKNEPAAVTLLGNGSMEFVTQTSNFVRFRNTNFHGTLLSSLTELSFSCFIKNRENNLDANYIVLQIDKNGDGATDDRLEFDPRFQTGNYIAGIGPDQGQTVVGVWQTWDAFHGGWWIGPEPDPDAGGEMFTLATYISHNPNARIVNDPALAGGGIRLSAGAPFPLFAHNFICYTDNFRIGVNGITTIYDFEYSIAEAGPDQNIIYGYGSNCTELRGSASGGVAPYTFSWSPGGSSPTTIKTEVCPTATTTYNLTVTDARDCNRTDNVTIIVNDVRCGNKMDKVKICHDGADICISPDAVASHLKHGDVLGACPNSSITTTSGKLSAEARADDLRLLTFPNPFFSSTRLQYELPFDANVSIKLYDMQGIEIKTLFYGYKESGRYSTDLSSSGLVKGTYFCRFMVVGKYKIISKAVQVILMNK